MNNTGPTVTIKSIAEALGVSFSTVAKALKDDPRISPQTRKLVQDKAEEMHYNRNYFAQSLRRKHSRTVAIIANDLDIQTYGEMIASISGSLAAQGYTTVISDSLYSEQFERTSIQNVLSRMPEAVIVSPIDSDGENLKLLEPFYSKTLVLGEVRPCLQVSSAAIDHRMAGRLSAEHMLRHSGSDNLIFLGPDNFRSSTQFLEGVTQAYEACGLQIPSEAIHHFRPNMQTAHSTFLRLWQEHPGAYTGVICFCDSMALGIYQAAQELSLRIPEDISVIGYDDGPANQFLSPPLTSVYVPAEQVAAACSDFVLKRLIQEDTGLYTTGVQPTLSDRGSVRKSSQPQHTAP